jgi:hypothetical protein
MKDCKAMSWIGLGFARYSVGLADKCSPPSFPSVVD